MSERSARLSLPYLMPAQAQKHVTHNEALQSLDLWVQLAVESCGAEMPPVAPEEGQVWALGPAPTGGWAGQGHALAIWSDGSWRFETVPEGAAAVDLSAGAVRIWDGSAWQAPALPEFAEAQGLGLNATPDAQNRLSVAAPATLLSHEGAGHQLKINKAADTDTASLLFQSSWSGRAEMGTTGTDDFSIKVSPDGTTWTEALTVDGASGHITGAAVQATALDDTPGTLLTVGSFGLGDPSF